MKLDDPGIIFHICTDEDWRAGSPTRPYRGTAQDRRDGFIHFSTGAQLAGTAARYFAGRDGLVVLAVRLSDLGDALVWEAPPGRPAFPHLYDDLARDAVAAVHAMPLGPDGRHITVFLENPTAAP